MFSYQEYEAIIRIIKESGKQATFREAKSMDRFVIMRHDVEFSVDRAYQLSLLEKEMNFTSTYFFQWTNNAYNLLSKKNTDMITKMHQDGHTIGLHFAVNGLTDIRDIKAKIEREINALNRMLEFEIDAFSVHRPSKEILKSNIKIPGITNAYDDRFFTFSECAENDDSLKVKYISDAQHKWNYGKPDRDTIMNFDKVQILTHPYSWTKDGLDNLNNFRTLIQEIHCELEETINHECKHFAQVREQI